MANSSLSCRSITVAVLVVMVTLTMTSLTAALNQDKVAKESDLICRLLASSVSIAHKAGQIIRDVFQKGDLGIIDKGNMDFQTEADRSAQQCIVASFKNLYPNVTVIAEEVDSTSQNLNVSKDWLITDLDSEILNLKCPKIYNNITENNVTLWIDPLDGTSEFTKGHSDHVTTLIGISVNSVPVAGVIYQPFWGKRGRAIWGLVGRGVGGLVMKKPPANDLIYLTSNSHYDKTIERFFNHLKPCKIIRVGGAGNKVVFLLEGKAHAYIYPSNGLSRWDTAASEAVIRAAGGELTDTLGNNYNYSKINAEHPFNRYGVFASAPSFNRTKLQSHINEVVEVVRRKFRTL